MSKLSRTFRIAAAILVTAFSGNLLPAATTYAATAQNSKPVNTAAVDKPWICHPVNGKGELGNGWNLIDPSKASSHIDESKYPDGTYWKHESNDKKRHDAYAVNGVCPGTEATPSVNVVDKCGTEDDSVTGVTTKGISYTTTKDGLKYTVIATPDTNYELVVANGFTLNQDDTATYEVSLTDLPCDTPDKDATPQAVAHIDVCGKKNDTYTIPNVEGVDYYVDGVLVLDSTYTAPKNAPRSVTITTQAQDGYQLTEEYSETIDFTNEKCAKVTICHRTNSVINPYNKITVSVNAVDGIAGNNTGKDHYGEHDETDIATSQAVAQSLKDQHKKWGDIIPPVAPHHDGLNWTEEAQAIYNNDCNYVTEEPTPVTPEAPTTVNLCYNDSDYITIPENEGIIYKIDGQVVSGSVPFTGANITITAEAAEGYVLENYDGPWTFTGADFASKDCLEINKEFKSYEDTDKNGVVTAGDKVIWTITVTNHGTDLNDAFQVEVEDLATVVIDQGLAANTSVTKEFTTTISADDMRACKATNTATFSAWRYTEVEVPSVALLEDAAAVNSPLATGSASAEYSFTCPTPGKGSEKPPVVTPEAPSAPNTGVPAQLPQTGADNAAPIFTLIAATLIYGVLYVARRKFEQ